MTDIEKEQDAQAAVSEQHVVAAEESTPQDEMVPLSALQAERRKRQEIEAQNRLYAEYVSKHEGQQAHAEQQKKDPSDWLTYGEYQATEAQKHQALLEQVYLDSNPEKLQEINQHLENIIEKKPWLRQTVLSAPNRYAMAYEIVQDYKHLVTKSKTLQENAQRIVQNAQKPGSPANVGRASNQSQADYLKSIQGTKEFANYRKELMSRR